ncbi:MAG: Nif3-like dinuclear metal center hexameric protein [Spirochaetales bacterium]|nr:Nif3-like dinuclear metal center hexameric protein [Spirochaetales bacterium]MCF7938755.1 Nif3-like dinuclear metal center hexameric protein [Spirochaetales bacterium]
MQLQEFENYLQELFQPEEVAGVDPSMNGIQVSRKNQEVGKAAFAVDACLDSFERAADWGADLLVVHHGLFWGKPLKVAGSHRARLDFLLKHDMALAAMHLPLDRHAELGNNAVLAHLLGLEEVRPFGEYKGRLIGMQGCFPEAVTPKEAARLIDSGRGGKQQLLPFGPESVKSVGIVSGGASGEVAQAIDAGLDMYITGDADHSIYHLSLESGINVLFAGHYETEIWGVRALAQRVAEDTDIETLFFDVPTGL